MNGRPLLAAVLSAVTGVFVVSACGSTKGASHFTNVQDAPDADVGDDDADAGSTDDASVDDDGSTPSGGGFDLDGSSPRDTGSTCITSISGKVYDPAGKNALYGVVAYVPSKAVSPFKGGVTCDTCTSLFTGAPLVTSLTDATGSFKLTGVNPGTNVPLVVQVGKWRKQITIPKVTACKDNPQADKSLRLPKNKAEGDLPSIAISTGAADTLECLFKRMGFDDAEFVPGASTAGHIHIFQGSPIQGRQSMSAPNTNPPGPSSPTKLWDSAADIDPYDMVILSCEGRETQNLNQQVLFDYAAKGGRVFASHFHYAWFNSGPFGAQNLATWSHDANPINALAGTTIPGTIVTKLPTGGKFPKGQAMQDWLGNVGALTNSTLPISYACHNADWTVANKTSQQWITVEDPLVDATTNQQSSSTTATEYLSFNTPFGQTSEAQCGKVVYSDLHVGSASGDEPSQPVPGECAATDLSPQEKALEFMLFDLAACVTPVDAPAVPPPPGIQ